MRVKDAAKRLEVSSSLIYQLIAEGKLQAARHGIGRGTIRISEEQLAEYLELAGAPSEPLRFIR